MDWFFYGRVFVRFNSSSLRFLPAFAFPGIWLGLNGALFQNWAVFSSLITHHIRFSYLEQVNPVREKKRRYVRELAISNGAVWCLWVSFREWVKGRVWSRRCFILVLGCDNLVQTWNRSKKELLCIINSNVNYKHLMTFKFLGDSRLIKWKNWTQNSPFRIMAEEHLL